MITVLRETGYPEQGYLTLEVRRGDTFAESIAIAREAVEAGKRMERLYAETA